VGFGERPSGKCKTSAEFHHAGGTFVRTGRVFAGKGHNGTPIRQHTETYLLAHFPTHPWRALTGPAPPPLDSLNATTPVLAIQASPFFPGSLPTSASQASPTRLPDPNVDLPISSGRFPVTRCTHTCIHAGCGCFLKAQKTRGSWVTTKCVNHVKSAHPTSALG